MIPMSIELSDTRHVMHFKPRLAPLLFLVAVYCVGSVAVYYAHAPTVVTLVWMFFAIGIIWLGGRIYYAPMSTTHEVSHYRIPSQYVSLKGGVMTVHNMPIRIVPTAEQLRDMEQKVRRSDMFYVSHVVSRDMMRDAWVYDDKDFSQASLFVRRDQHDLLKRPEFYFIVSPYKVSTTDGGAKFYTPTHIRYSEPIGFSVD